MYCMIYSKIYSIVLSLIFYGGYSRTGVIFLSFFSFVNTNCVGTASYFSFLFFLIPNNSVYKRSGIVIVKVHVETGKICDKNIIFDKLTTGFIFFSPVHRRFQRFDWRITFLFTFLTNQSADSVRFNHNNFIKKCIKKNKIKT